ncbi:MAG TPA: type II secretion system protein [Mesotoga infera]|uniref:Type II secretion system protein n=1 Tax=Mesotoga infera TaxID=1236046 RepID=A0A7C1CW83_9BACT|nr:type II secretion system protein [Mesotoga infera]
MSEVIGNRPARKQGFSLVEIVMSLVIVMVIIAAVLPALTKSMQQANRNRHLTTELSRVQKALEEEYFVPERSGSYSVVLNLDAQNIVLSGELVSKEFAENKKIDIFLRER